MRTGARSTTSTGRRSISSIPRDESSTGESANCTRATAGQTRSRPLLRAYWALSDRLLPSRTVNGALGQTADRPALQDGEIMARSISHKTRCTSLAADLALIATALVSCADAEVPAARGCEPLETPERSEEHTS